MSEPELFKIGCPFCAQHIEYPVEGVGQTIPCPTCERELLLPEPALAPPPIPHSDRLGRPASDAQKEKLRFFGCTFDEGITMDDASSALDECERQFPEREKEYQARKPTTEQIKQLKEFGLDAEGMNRSEGRRAIESAERNEFMDYLDSEDGQIDEETDRLNYDWADDYREVSREEVARAWAYIKQKTGKAPGADNPSHRTIELLDALKELFDDFTEKPTKPGVLTYYCLHCRGPVEIVPPRVPPGRVITPAHFISISVKCPHCGQDTDAHTINV